MRNLLPVFFVVTAAMSLPVSAQNYGYSISGDVGLGVAYSPSYMGSDENDGDPWVILRNGQVRRSTSPTTSTTDGFSVLPSFNFVRSRDADDHDDLNGMDDISTAGEIGVKLGYTQGAANGYIDLRKGFGGHSGLVGEFGAKYRHEMNDRLTFTGRAEAQFANDDYVETYFGVSDSEAITSGYDAYAPGGGIYAASIALEARYALTEKTAVIGEVKYLRLLGDAADSPIVKDRDQPFVRLGIVRHFDIRF